ncbi:hypothetical protein N7532_009749 [Penicillium argentinense]|uniref:Uncharacterized protein n=1 Tax=Penicillium argentinense TaxID=1131581 RepID=A0A9W9ENA4_9EURO|nr:uncharacterized protein N7532_009749 [Penicillium argentinense]KAJ5084978.1 hypothetical protein N7532_009749 [Penicillium argentinense]
MRTRQKRPTYRVLNDESDGKFLPDDRTDQTNEPSELPNNLTHTLPACQESVEILANIPDCELLPSESVSQVVVSQESSTDADTSITSHYREKLLEFAELQGIHSGENLAIAVENMLIELSLKDKLISITGDNASNNEAMASELFFSLSDRPSVEEAMPAPLYRSLDSYISCLAHVLNLIVKNILPNLGSGTMEQAQVACDCLQAGNSITDHSAIGILRVLALWINRSPQRRQKWKEVCRLNNLPDKFVAYDVTTRWNSTFRMVDDGLKSRQQVNKFLNLQEKLPPFTLQDWSRLEQIHTVLHKFNELTLFISKRNPQISLAVPIYYELHELLDDVREGNDGNAGTIILETIRTHLHQVYAASNPEHDAAASQSTSLQHSDVESRMLKKLQVRDPPLSDIYK